MTVSCYQADETGGALRVCTRADYAAMASLRRV